MVSITKCFEFEAAHFLPNYKGLCRFVHGHSYKLEVEVAGEINKEGFIMDFSDLKQIVKDNIIVLLDHTLLNDILPYKPTAENMVEQFAEKLSSIEGLIRIRLWETSTSYAEWKKDVS